MPEVTCARDSVPSSLGILTRFLCSLTPGHAKWSAHPRNQRQKPKSILELKSAPSIHGLLGCQNNETAIRKYVSYKRILPQPFFLNFVFFILHLRNIYVTITHAFFFYHCALFN